MSYLNLRTMERTERPNLSVPVAPVVEQGAPSIQEQGYTASQDRDDAPVENTILQTQNYALFRLDPLNRRINPDKLDRLYDAAQKKNLLHLFPIVVTRDHVIVDGQHRYKVAQALNVPIYYIVSSQMRIEDAAFVNTNVSRWTGIDYLDHWCRVGLPDYIRAKEFWEANPFLSFSNAIRILAYHGRDDAPIMSHSSKESLFQVFYDGRFKITNLAFAQRGISMCRDFSRWVTFWKDTRFIGAVISLADHAEYDHAHMMQKMEYLSTRVVKCPDLKSYMKVLEDVYNHKTLSNKRIQLSPSYQTRRATSKRESKK